jgi:hypothetical protein
MKSLHLIRVLALTLALGSGHGAASAAERVALVIGCGKYQAQGVPELSTPVNDARRMTEKLRATPMGFDVVEVLEATRNGFFDGLSTFKTRAQGAKVVLVYFSGHGIEFDGVNYCIPVDAVLEKPSHVDSEAIDLGKILATLQATGAEAKIAVLDACRNNPFGQTKSWRDGRGKNVSSGVLAALGDAQLPEATLVCFATSPGRKAAAILNDDSQNSPFTEHLLQHLTTPGAHLRDIFETTADAVAKATQNRQLPYVKYDGAASVLRQLVLAPAITQKPATPSTPPVAAVAAPVPVRMEIARIDSPKPPAMPSLTPSSLPGPKDPAGSLAEKIALLQPMPLPTPSFQYFLSTESKTPPVKKIPLKLLSQKANTITDEEEWLAKLGLERDGYRVPETAKTAGTAWIKGTRPLPAGLPVTFREHELIGATSDPGATVLLYHTFPLRPRYLVAVDLARGVPLVAFDFENFAFSPSTKNRKHTRQGINWAAQRGDILYVSSGHRTYAKDSGGQNAYLFAISIPDQKLLWSSRPLVCNSENFLVVGDVIITGYGYTEEPDFLYQINRWTGEILDTIKMKSGPEYLARKDGKLFVRTYDTDYVFDCPGE